MSFKPTLYSKIRKLMMAFQVKYGIIYLYNREQRYSSKTGNRYTVCILSKLVPLTEYKKLHPRTKKKSGMFKVPVCEDLKEINIVFYLANQYKQMAGDSK